MTSVFLRAGCVLAAATVYGAAASPPPRPQAARWVTAWGTSQQGVATRGVTNTTVRMIARVTAAGDAVRIRLDNTFGPAPLVVGRASVGLRIQGAELAAGSTRPVSFGGAGSVTIPAGGSVTSDAVPLHVLAQQDLAVTMHIPGENVRPSQHTAAQVTSYVAADGAGDLSAEESAVRFTGTTTSMWWLKAVEVRSASATGTIVAFGDSITDGTCSTPDAHDRWEDLLAVRLALEAANRGMPDVHKAVVNEGIGGNTVTRSGLTPAPDSPPGVERLERDVLGHPGVTHVILFMGTNDVRREAPGAQVIAGVEEIVKRVKARGLTVIGATIVPRHNRPPMEGNTGWDAGKTRIRREINQWIRTAAPFDAVIDFDRMVQDPADPDRLYPPFNCGDGIHPSPRGYYEMGRLVPLDLFR